MKIAARRQLASDPRPPLPCLADSARDRAVAPARAVRRTGRGHTSCASSAVSSGAIRGTPIRVFLGVAATVVGLSILAPVRSSPLVARRPVDYFTFNPWLKRFRPTWSRRRSRSRRSSRSCPLSRSSGSRLDSPYGGTEWGFAVDVTDVARILLLAGLFGAYFALLARGRAACAPAKPGMRWPPAGRRRGHADQRPGPVDRAVQRHGMRSAGAPRRGARVRRAVQRDARVPRGPVAGHDRLLLPRRSSAPSSCWRGVPGAARELSGYAGAHSRPANHSLDPGYRAADPRSRRTGAGRPARVGRPEASAA